MSDKIKATILSIAMKTEQEYTVTVKVAGEETQKDLTASGTDVIGLAIGQKVDLNPLKLEEGKLEKVVAPAAAQTKRSSPSTYATMEA